ncbi:MAG: hypothetical protein H0V89_09945 [Deltaproteobacteria bacterium]|nr:hypothetical protein [Deltaproteobacteria bacterium]
MITALLLACTCRDDPAVADVVGADTDVPEDTVTTPLPEPETHSGDTGTTHETDTAAELTWVSADIGYNLACGLVSDGTVRCWGTAECEAVTPRPDETFTAISVGGEAGCGLRPDGTVRCWCCDEVNTGDICLEAPPGSFDRVLVGNHDACAQDSAGILTCWGGQPFDREGEQPVGPVIDFQVESTYAAALLPDGTVQAWGYDVLWQEEPPAGVAFTDLGLGRGHACGLDASGAAWCWGQDFFGRPFPDPPPGPWSAIEVYNQTTCVFDSGGLPTCFWSVDVALWEEWESQMIAVQPLVQIGLGEWNGCGVDAVGQAWCWGGDPAVEPCLRVPQL